MKMPVRRTAIALLLAWLAMGVLIYGGGGYEAAHSAGSLGDVPEALLACDAACVLAWVRGLDPPGREAYLRFQGLDIVHALLTSILLGLAAIRLAPAAGLPRALALLAPVLLAASELIENAVLALLAARPQAALLSAVAVEFRLCKFVAFATSLLVVASLAATAGIRRIRRSTLGAP